MMPLVGQKISTTTSDFWKVIKEEFLYVDKSLFIQELIEDGDEALLITCPRRFGKTLNMSMLQYFFAKQVREQSTKGLFDKLQIAKVKEGEYIKKHQGQFPVIFLSLKDIKESSFEM